jgi:hypothetical protein
VVTTGAVSTGGNGGSAAGESIFDPIGPDSSRWVPVGHVFVKGRRELSGATGSEEQAWLELSGVAETKVQRLKAKG